MRTFFWGLILFIILFEVAYVTLLSYIYWFSFLKKPSLITEKNFITKNSTSRPVPVDGQDTEASPTSAIPKIVYVTSCYSGVADMPEDTRLLLEETERSNAGWEIKHFSDREVEHMLEAEHHPSVLEAFRSIVPGAYKADIFRYAVLSKRGGVYMDLNSRLYRPLDEIVDVVHDKVVLVQDRTLISCGMRPGVQIAFVASRKDDPNITKCLEKAVENVLNKDYGRCTLDITGPTMAASVFQKVSKKDYTCTMYMAAKSGDDIYDYYDKRKLVIKRHCNNHYKTMYETKKDSKPRYSTMYESKSVFA